MGKRIGNVRAYGLATATMLTGFLAGYDSGVAGGILTFDSFANDFGYSTDDDAKVKQVNSFTVGLLNLGCLVACWIFFPLAAKLGRRIPILIAAAVFLVGVIVQTVNTGSLGGWYAGRIIAGIGQGGLTIVTPPYCAEMAPKEIRGRLGSFYQWLFTWGIFTAYWTNYGVGNDLASTTRQWQIPVAMQLISGSLLAISMLFLKESVRWLLKKGRHEEAWKSLVWVRGSSDEAVVVEFEHIKAGVREELEVAEGRQLRELFDGPNIRRFSTGALVFLFQQTTGANALAYFAPQFFAAIVGKGTENLLITGLFGAIKVVACTIFIIFVSEALNRRTLMAGGAAVQAACMIIVAVLDKEFPAPENIPKNVPPSGKAEVAMIFLAIVAYNFSWGPIPWAYAPEIFPNRIRELGMAVSVSFHWAFSFCFTFSTSYMIDSLGWGIFLFFGVFDIIATFVSFLFFRETRGKSLETVDRIFTHRIAKDGTASSPEGSDIMVEEAHPKKSAET